MSEPSDRRSELTGWITKSQNTRKRLRIGVAAGAVIAVGLLVWDRAIGGVALATVAIVALCGFWIIAAHIADWRTKLEELDKPRPVGRVIRRR